MRSFKFSHRVRSAARVVRLASVVAAFALATSVSGCVVYAHPIHPYYYR